jgi:phage terminase large subunit-like protein
MLDRFAVEINRVHDARARLAALSSAERAVLARSLTDEMAEDWIFAARDAQLPPRDLDWCWLFLGGRGTGKTHSVSSAVHMAVRSGLKRIHVIAPTTADVHDVNLEGSSGILATSPQGFRPRWVASKRRLEWPNGAMAVMFSGEEPDSLRGPQCELAVIDEIGRMRYQQEVFDMMMFGLRLGDKPRVLIATTPRPTPFMKKLTRMDDIRITSGTTFDNAEHLSASFMRKMRELYEGTRLGRQELLGGMILDPGNALFKDDWLRHELIKEEEIELVTVGVDPSGGADDVGIVVCALLNDGRYGVLADRTLTASPGQWGDEVIRAHDEFDADDVVVERNFGGDMVQEVVKQAAERAYLLEKRKEPTVRVQEVVASRGKTVRAEPISLLYEKGRVLHNRGLDQLEGEMLSFSREWDRSVDGSPNRLDAMVWGLSRLSRVVTHIPMA